MATPWNDEREIQDRLFSGTGKPAIGVRQVCAYSGCQVEVTRKGKRYCAAHTSRKFVRHEIPERCNRPAWRCYVNGYRLCSEHAYTYNDPTAKCEYSEGPCDYPMDGLGAARYEPLPKRKG